MNQFPPERPANGWPGRGLAKLLDLAPWMAWKASPNSRRPLQTPAGLSKLPPASPNSRRPLQTPAGLSKLPPASPNSRRPLQTPAGLSKLPPASPNSRRPLQTPAGLSKLPPASPNSRRPLQTPAGLSKLPPASPNSRRPLQTPALPQHLQHPLPQLFTRLFRQRFSAFIRDVEHILHPLTKRSNLGVLKTYAGIYQRRPDT